MNFKHDPKEAIEGVLWSYRGGWLTLKDVSAMRAEAVPVKIPGEVVMHRSAISFTQVLP